MPNIRNKRGKKFVTLMLVIAVCALLLRVAVEKIIKVSISQNEAAASSTIKLIATALENYAKDKQGVFPTDLSVLTKTTPPYLDKNYLSHSSIKGYYYSCPRLEPTGYSCLATPKRCNLTGKAVYTITTGALFVSEECSKKE